MQGLRPLMYSVRTAEVESIGWFRNGDDICYYQNSIKRKSGSYHTLTFTIETPCTRSGRGSQVVTLGR